VGAFVIQLYDKGDVWRYILVTKKAEQSPADRTDVFCFIPKTDVSPLFGQTVVHIHLKSGTIPYNEMVSLAQEMLDRFRLSLRETAKVVADLVAEVHKLSPGHRAQLAQHLGDSLKQ
jgi:hypothetical protein